MDPKSFQMKMQGKELEREARRCQKEAAAQRKKAKLELKKGNRAAAQMYAQNAVRYDQQANSLLQNCSATQGFATDMRTAAVSAQMATTMQSAATGMEQCSKKINLEKVAANRTKMDGLKQKMGAAHELLVGGEGEMEIGAGAEDLLAALEAENAEDAMNQIADIPTGLPVGQVGVPNQGLRDH